jgi:hypothetical protein
LVCADPATYTHAQQIQYRQLTLYPYFGMITPDLRKEAKELSTLANECQLPLLLGAGVSVASDCPTWFQFLLLLEDCFPPGCALEERSLDKKHKWGPLLMADDLDRISRTNVDMFAV